MNPAPGRDALHKLRPEKNRKKVDDSTRITDIDFMKTNETNYKKAYWQGFQSAAKNERVADVILFADAVYAITTELGAYRIQKLYGRGRVGEAKGKGAGAWFFQLERATA